MIVSLTTHDRPEYLAPTLDHLLRASEECPEPLTLVVHCEPGSDACGDQLNGYREVSGDVVLVEVNHRVLGLQANTFKVLTHAWDVAEARGEDYVLHLEDDLLLAPDALRLAVWVRERYRDDPRVLFFGAKNVAEPPPPEDYLRVVLTDWFGCHAWATWRTVWDEEMRPKWRHQNVNFWAVMVNEDILPGRPNAQVIPSLSRCVNIGKKGTNAHPLMELRETQLFAGDVELPEGEYFERGWVDPAYRTQA